MATEPRPEPGPDAGPPRRRLPVLGVPIDVLTADGAAAQIVAWARESRSRVVCLCNVHAVVSAASDSTLRQALQQADLAAPDGAPVAWMMRRLGAPAQRRVAGPDLMADTLALAATTGVAVYLYGGTAETLARLQPALMRRWPTLRLAGSRSPPFRPLTAAELEADFADIRASGAGIVWVGLGCPKQERWMAAHREQLPLVLVGVGAAFDFLGGRLARAPLWMRRCGLEWLFRLLQEPRRLAGRYLVTNTRFVLGAACQLLRGR
jgi:N-acetylglucosaminyldiphosphoundecaprenol N-acetyl-beta-D-mannosaminyltransferase